MNSLGSLSPVGASSVLSAPLDVTPAASSLGATMPFLGTPQIMVPERR
jgi:hypothetical protein